MSKSSKLQKSDVKVEDKGTQPRSQKLTSNPVTKSRTASKVMGSVIPWDNDAKLIHSGNAGGKGWLPEDVSEPEYFSSVNSGGWDDRAMDKG